jgi:hypothetical protein
MGQLELPRVVGAIKASSFGKLKFMPLEFIANEAMDT